MLLNQWVAFLRVSESPRLILFFAVLLCVLNFSCFRPKDTGVIRVANFLTDPVLIQILQQTLTDLEKDNPGLKIQLETTPYTDYQQKIATQIAGGIAPDILYVEVNNFVDLYLRNALEDLTPYVQKDKFDLGDYYPTVLQRFTQGGGLYALPQDTAPTGLVYYNRAVFREAGVPYPKDDWNWPEDFLAVCQKLVKRDATGKIIRWAYCDAYPVQYTSFLYSSGADFVDDPLHPTRLALDSPEAMRAIQFRWDLIHKYHVSPSTTEIQAFSFGSGVEQMLVNGSIAMMDSGIWHTPQLLKAKTLDFDVAMFPKGPAGKRGWGMGGSGYAICKASKNKEAAWKVLQALVGVTNLTRLTQAGMIQPALMKLSHSDVFLKAPGAAHKEILLDMPANGHYTPMLANWNEIFYGNLGPALDPVWMGTKTPAQVIPEITKRINDTFFKKGN
jgi:multiple sugar transport system substrate-binding protein